MKHPVDLAQKTLLHIKRLEHRLDAKELDRLTGQLGANICLANDIKNPEEAKKHCRELIARYSTDDPIDKKQVSYYMSDIQKIDCALKHGIRYRDYVLRCR